MPQPKAGHVLIRIKGFGVVHDAGGGKWKEGDVVAAILGGMGRQFDGGYAEYTLVPHSSVSPPISLPKNVGWEKFAAIPETFMTAWGTLHQSLHLKATDSLYIHGGSSSLGLAIASLAKSSLFNVSTVISTTRAEHKIATVRRSGADHVILDTGSVSAEVKKLTGGVGATRVQHGSTRGYPEGDPYPYPSIPYPTDPRASNPYGSPAGSELPAVP
ncbi:GroES-like protein [Mycena sanguinolenta]|uniref:GroES-like protein n=1 Tax=Mycena sanguinolenta TaxID=230812 RepID=A0A8H6ZE72_9AGAR|nr:GroES-like protein [Mycena sanguinolenta]